jgi:hypothetical protein
VHRVFFLVTEKASCCKIMVICQSAIMHIVYSATTRVVAAANAIKLQHDTFCALSEGKGINKTKTSSQWAYIYIYIYCVSKGNYQSTP